MQKLESELAFEVKTKLRESVKAELLKQKNLDVHQAILNVCYDHYQNILDSQNQQLEIAFKPTIRWDYEGLLEITDHDFGSLAWFAIMIGKFNEQVENGGIEQYWSNKYASFNYPYKEIYIHANLIRAYNWFKKEFNEFKQTDELQETVAQINDILLEIPESIKFTISVSLASFDTNGDRQDFEDDYCENCLTEDSQDMLERLNRRYYRYNEKLMEILNQYFMNYLFDETEQAEIESKIKTTDN